MHIDICGGYKFELNHSPSVRKMVIGLAGSNYCRVILTAQSLYANLNYPEIPDSWINFIYLHINHLHYLNSVLISIHQLTTR